MNRFTKEFWDSRYQAMQIGWDTGGPTTPFIELFKSVTDKNIAILIPGCGHAHEGEYLFNLGFNNITLLDYSPLAKEAYLKRVPGFPENQFVIGDFFSHHGQYDIILEQTFFCALEPDLRKKYAEKMLHLLKPGGFLHGLLFTFPLTDVGPPFGGSKEEYEAYFSGLFSIKTMEPCHNSIQPRMGNELFFSLQKPHN